MRDVGPGSRFVLELPPERGQRVWQQLRRFEQLLSQRRSGVPIAYLLGEQGFWSLQLEVSESTLIPRPDTERLVEVALELGPQGAAEVLDLGTGTGPAPHAPFGGMKQSGIGRENHLMMLNHYQQTKNLLVSYSPKKLGFF